MAPDARWNEEAETARLQSQVAAMSYLRYVISPVGPPYAEPLRSNSRTVGHREHSSIPIPAVHTYASRKDSVIGMSYMLMDYVDGETADTLSEQFSDGYEGIPPPFAEHFMRQMAKIMVELASLRFPKIGGLVKDGASVRVGPMSETGAGPYDSPLDFYRDHPLAVARCLDPDQDISRPHPLVEACRQLMVSTAASQPDYGLMFADLGPNNVIVDRAFNIKAVIDWDPVFTAPDPVLHRVPFLMGMACPPPGKEPSHPDVPVRARMARQFSLIVHQVAHDSRTREHPARLNVAGFHSRGALWACALTYYQFRQDFVRDWWLQALSWLSCHSDEDVHRWYDALADSASMARSRGTPPVVHTGFGR
ncbi:MAG: hypothetical protein M1826_002249 [Phylliscum demangeonii]|nr:MAG: hypothetical protein M1826_002249 [Phylliscum demangeonii]